MSVVLYKDGESGVFEVKQMAGLLNGGWSTEDKPHVVQKEDEEETPEDVRQVAKDAGIEGWENKRIKTLKAELNEQQT